MMRGPLETATGATADTTIYVEQEGAFVHISVQAGDDDQNKRLDALLTPDQAEAMSYMLSEEGKNARGFAS